MKKLATIIFGLLLIISYLSGSCYGQTASQKDTILWYQSVSNYNCNNIDVIYLVSTNIISAKDSKGNVAWRAELNENDVAAITAELAWVEQNMFDSGFNFYAPYYHQFTFDALTQLTATDFGAVYKEVAAEACKAFDEYMTHFNNGRPFVLAGFSQGAMLTLDVLKQMTDEQYARMIACYTIGYRLSEADLQHPHIQAATGESEKGVVISFNSTQTEEAIWPLVSDGAATCINPINWKTDATPATFQYEGTENRVHVDTLRQVLIVETSDPSPYYQFMDAVTLFADAGASRDNLHHWDLLFYNRQIHDNALRRAGIIK